ncbi:PREDICTED: tyrosine kinase receptor Cad96Ca-like isoform X1 [Amphimedon queenslandica]|uniref:Protein kinase domain-containing protein n=1 Tax=Amphimedon queenslandica TaxID=400682 RepID=A0AAN0JF95_AMPQE|nr:PREDICTED: tyrosine kinase receptor Cad96Ca-like isoform X1 [Amphimedon queenslandica]|eukprot:XP_019855447.1 PREDICTED: tyrosine kinase receptor Cad96Ca-like isoform X1 [Amphimedon queenslandica]
MKLLHLWQCYTIISAGLLHTVHTQCTAGSDETGTTSANPIFGMVLNIDDRAECTGHIGRVEYTYYQGVKINNQIRNFVSSVSVWSQSSTVFNLRGIRQYLAKTSSNPAGNRGNTVSVTPPLFIRKGEVIGIYVPAPQGNERDVTFVADGSGSICVNGSSGNSISCSTLNGKILRAKATITPITCSIPILINGRILESPNGLLISSLPLINDIVYYKCNPGYILTGPSLSECVLNGESGALNETVPTCQNEITPPNLATSPSITPSTTKPTSITRTPSSKSVLITTVQPTTTQSTTSDDLMTVTTDRVCPTCTIDNSPTPTTGAVDSSNMTLLILGTISGTALMIALLVLGALVILFTVFITKRRKKNSNNMIENPCCKIDALYQTVQDDSSDNNKRQNKNETRVICSIISEYDEPPTSRTHDSHVEEYEMPVMVSTNSHPTEPRGAGAVSPVANKPTGYEVPGYFTLEEGEHYYRHLKQVMTEKEKEIKYTPPARDEGQLYMQLCHAKQIQSDSLVLDSRLGSGQFGEVYKGRLGDKMVAVKLMKEGSLHEERVKFLQEAAIMRQFNNLNIVKMHGIVFENEKAMIVMELLENGDLQNYLLKLKRKYSIVIGVFILLIPIHSNKASPYQLLNFCRQICLGMTYLSCKGFIHCDLAARNVLLSKENICKIADFGMSCDLENEAYYYSKGGKIPIKWTAPEAVIKRKYSSASDVWSYGCVLYEIWSLGRKPFETYSNIYALEKVKDGYRLPPPPGCPRSIYKHMIQCWHPIPRERPDFHRLMLSMLQLESEENDELPSPEAGQLGGGLEAGEMLYPDLQNAYRGMKVNYN